MPPPRNQSDATYYNRKSNYGRMRVSDLKRLKETGVVLSQDKNKVRGARALEQWVVGSYWEKSLRPPEKRQAPECLMAIHDLSKTQACAALKLNLPRSKKQRLPTRVQQPMEVDARANAEWSMDFMSDTLYHGCRFRTLNILDEDVREAQDIVNDTSIPGGRVVRTLDQLLEWRGEPEAIRVDKGPEYISQAFVDWCDDNDVTLKYIQPGTPNQNAYIERFNRTCRNEVLNAYVFETLIQVQDITGRWIRDYIEGKPHSSLGQQPPAIFRRQVENAGNYNFELSH